MEKIIEYFGAPAIVRCDENCAKAWGINSRPSVKLSDDPDDFAWLPDNELEIAPIDPGTMEGEDRKPIDLLNIPNKWCVRECERCIMSHPDKYNDPKKVRDLNKRVYNQPWKHPNTGEPKNI